MHKKVSLGIFMMILSFNFGLSQPKSPEIEISKQHINWMTWAEVQTALKTNPKPIIVDVYTSWCGWCKFMDKTTFKNRKVISYINNNMYAVKFDAETKTPIQFDGNLYENKELGHKRGSHDLANAILNDEMSYPTIVYFNENLERITISTGFKKSKALLKELSYVTEKAYLSMDLHDYINQ